VSARGGVSIELDANGRLPFDRCVRDLQNAQPRRELEYPLWEMPEPREAANSRWRVDGVPEAILPMLRERGISFRRIDNQGGNQS
jgi:hypothetical protein